jgi:2-desacetyl-2-hydroxyethyl bacteriochlorophyllide A dehydrogenase
MAVTNRAVRWPRPGATELADLPYPSAAPGEAVVDVLVSVCNPGTERARYLALPNATVGFPHVPGIGSAGLVAEAAPDLPVGALVAVRSAPHQSVLAVPAQRVERLPGEADPIDGALWQLGLIGFHGLRMGRYRAGEPLTVVGAGLIGAMTRRLAAAWGSPECTVVAASDAKRWSTEGESTTRFIIQEQSVHARDRHALVVDASGTAAGLATAVRMAADGGRVVLLGSPRVPTGAVPVRAIHERGLLLVGAHIDTVNDASAAAGTDLAALDTNAYFSLLAAGQLSLADLVTTYVPEQATVLYRQLVQDPSLIGAAVVWQRRVPHRGPAGASAGPSSPAALRFGLVGCGDIGAGNADALSRATNASLAACFDLDEGLARGLSLRTSARAARSLEELVGDPEIDAVLVATPHDTHEPLAGSVLAAGKHLLLQKPLAANLEAARRIVQAARGASTVTSMLLPGRYDSAYRRARAGWQAGSFGRPSGLIATYLVDKPPSYYRGGYSGRSASTWRLSRSRSGGGVLIMNLLHHIDLARSLLGREADWVCAQTIASPQSAEIEDMAAILVRFGEVVATFVGGASVPGGVGQHLRLWGTAGQCVVLPDWECRSSVGSELDAPPKPVADDPEAAAIDAFVSAVRDGREPDVTVDDALALQLIVEAAYMSARTGAPVEPAALLDGRLP